jgi:hypothetical protein
LLAAGLLLLSASVARADDTAKAIISKAIQAHGGAEKLAKLRVRQEKTKATSESDGQPVAVTRDTLVDLPDRWKVVQESERQGRKVTNVFGINGDKGWADFGKGPMELKGGLKGVRQQYYVLSFTPLLKDQRFKLSALEEAKVNDRPALGVKASAPDEVAIELYFDKESGLLVMSRRRVPSNMQELNLETLYSGYKETEGVKWPWKRVFYRDGNRTGEEEITELKFLDRINESEFDRP